MANERFEVERADFGLIHDPGADAGEYDENWTSPPFRVRHLGCDGALVYSPDQTDRPLSYYECGCCNRWTIHDLSKMSLAQLRGLFYVAYAVPECDGPHLKLMEVEERGIRFMALRTAEDQDIRNSCFRHLQELRARAK